MAELAALEAMAVQGAQEAMAEQGAQEAMAVQGAQEAMAELGAQEAMADRLRGLGLSPLGPAPTARPLLPPPPQDFPGEVRGYQEPSGARHRQTGQPTGTGSPHGRARKLRLLLGMTRHQGPSQGSLSYRFDFHDTGGRRLEWHPRPQQEEPPAPDKSPWTRPTR